jgi:hypothetical protein
MSDQQNDGAPDVSCLYAWLSRDLDGIEGVVTTILPVLGVSPLVFADEDRATRFTMFAREAAAERGHAARLVKFTRGEVIREVPPTRANKRE